MSNFFCEGRGVNGVKYWVTSIRLYIKPCHDLSNLKRVPVKTLSQKPDIEFPATVNINFFKSATLFSTKQQTIRSS